MWRKITSLLAACLCIIAATAVVSAAETSGPPKPVANVPMLEGALTLDGNTNEPMWAKALKVQIPRRYDETAPSSANDVTGEALLFWNNDGLHIAVRVTDKKLQAVGTDGDMTEYDSVEIWLDKLWVVAGLTSAGGSQFTTVNHNNWLPMPDGTVKVMVKKVSNGYVVEASIYQEAAKAILGKELAKGDQVRIAIGINNRWSSKDYKNNNRYYPSMYSWNNLESFALVELK